MVSLDKRWAGHKFSLWGVDQAVVSKELNTNA
jgi:hypothetical protein